MKPNERISVNDEILLEVAGVAILEAGFSPQPGEGAKSIEIDGGLRVVVKDGLLELQDEGGCTQFDPTPKGVRSLVDQVKFIFK